MVAYLLPHSLFNKFALSCFSIFLHIESQFIKMNHRILFTLFASLLLLFSCQSDPRKDAQASAVGALKPAFFICKESEEHKEELPLYEVFIKIKESKIKVAEINSCQKIESSDYQQYQIPETASDALSSWWAGAGSYLYILEKDQQYVVKERLVFEEDEASRPFLIKTILDENGVAVLPELRKSDLLGIYTLSLENLSYVLFVGMNGSDLDLKFFEIKGTLPPKEDLNHFLHLLNPQTLNLEEFNPYELIFYTEIGMGRFWREGNEINVSFLNREGGDGGPLVLKRVE